MPATSSPACACKGTSLLFFLSLDRITLPAAKHNFVLAYASLLSLGNLYNNLDRRSIARFEIFSGIVGYAGQNKQLDVVLNQVSACRTPTVPCAWLSVDTWTFAQAHILSCLALPPSTAVVR